MKSHGRVLVSLLAAAWLTAASAGLLVVADYDSKPGDPARPPQQWPGGVMLARSSTKPTVLMFLHPKCPCSRASLHELARLAHGQRDTLDMQVVFAQPNEVADDWAQSDLWESAVANSDFRVVIDHGGVLAKQFGAQTSGQALVYDLTGTLQFEGGITPGRGHAGDSFGRSVVQAIATGRVSSGPANCATYGCALSADARPIEKSVAGGSSDSLIR